jgi:hypothetical protein
VARVLRSEAANVTTRRFGPADLASGCEAVVPALNAAVWGSDSMQTYPVDVDAGQIVRWMRAESKAGLSRFRITARRSVETRDIPSGETTHLGADEREDLSEVATIATLEIAPAGGTRWTMRIVVEDEAGPRPIEDEAGAAGERTIDLEQFYSEFIRPGRGIAEVTAQVDSPAAKAQVTRLLSRIESNRHAPARGESMG